MNLYHLTTEIKMQLRTDSLTMVNIIVPNVLSFLTDGNDDIDMMAADKDHSWTDCDDDDDESGDVDEDKEDYDDGDGEGNDSDEDNDYYDDGDREGDGDDALFRPRRRRRVAG